MKVIVAGSRTITSIKLVHEFIDELISDGLEITEIVSGRNPRGVDAIGEFYAIKHKIPVKPFPANWKKFGLGAGQIRNTQMAEYADVLIAIWDGESTGTLDMIMQMRELKMRGLDKQIFVKEVNNVQNRS